jgi:hypothetical protein
MQSHTDAVKIGAIVCPAQNRTDCDVLITVCDCFDGTERNPLSRGEQPQVAPLEPHDLLLGVDDNFAQNHPERKNPESPGRCSDQATAALTDAWADRKERRVKGHSGPILNHFRALREISQDLRR